MMNTRFLSSALVATLTLPLTAKAFVSPSWTVGPVAPPPANSYAAPAETYAPPVAQPYAAPYAPPAMSTMNTAPMPGGSVPLLQPMYASSWDYRALFSCDVNGFYGFRAAPHSTYATDMAGMEIEFACYFTPRQAITLGFSVGVGGNDAVNTIDTQYGPTPVSENFTRSDITFSLGYRFTQALTPRTSISFGIKGGLDIQNLSYDDFWGSRNAGGFWEWNGWSYDYVYDDFTYSETRCGFAYAASVTLETRLTPRTQLQIGYQYRGATTEPDAPSVVPGGAPVSARSLRWHEVHVGLRFVF